MACGMTSSPWPLLIQDSAKAMLVRYEGLLDIETMASLSLTYAEESAMEYVLGYGELVHTSCLKDSSIEFERFGVVGGVNQVL